LKVANSMQLADEYNITLVSFCCLCTDTRYSRHVKYINMITY